MEYTERYIRRNPPLSNQYNTRSGLSGMQIYDLDCYTKKKLVGLKWKSEMEMEMEMEMGEPDRILNGCRVGYVCL